MTYPLRKALATVSSIGLAFSLAACEPDDAKTASSGQFSLTDISGPFSWPVNGHDGSFESMSQESYGDWAPLYAARPMVAKAPSRLSYAPAWDYPEDYYYDEPAFASYDDGYYEDSYYDSPYFERAFYGPVGYDWYDRSPDNDTYALLALAAVLGGIIGNSPPDYYFLYDDVQPWVWITEDRYVRYVEPLSVGYRYYYYAPEANYPFLVRDPLYTYGYNGDRLIVIYDSYGRVLSRDRALRLRRAASSYYERGTTLYRAGMTSEQYGVSAPLWQQRSATLAADQRTWDRAQNWNPGWKDWNRRYDKAVDTHWKRERIARTYAAKRFAAWEQDGLRGPAPQPGRELRAKDNRYKAVLEQAARETRMQDPRRVARSGRVQAERRQGEVERLERGPMLSASRAEKTDDRRSVREARLPRQERLERRDNRAQVRMNADNRREAARERGNATRTDNARRQDGARAERQQRMARERQSVREQAENRQQRAVRQEARAARQKADSQRAAREQQREQRARQQEANRQQADRRQQRQEQRRQNEAQTQRRQQEVNRQRMERQAQAASQRQQQARQQQRQQQAWQQQSQRNRAADMQRRQQVQSQQQRREMQRQMNRQQAAISQQQQGQTGQQGVRSQQQDRQATMPSEGRGQTEKRENNGRNR